MKWNKLIFGALVAGSLLAVQSCSKIRDFGNVNSNPNATTEPVTKALLTNALSGLGNTVWGNGITINAGLFAQYFSETQYTDASRYALTPPNWGGYYSGAMMDLQNIIDYNTSSPGKAAENGDNANQIAIARILKAYFYWILTDTWGDLPYLDALKGNGTIKYDAQQDIYTDLDKELSEAVDQFVAPTVTIKGDILFGGDINKWKKFANSMRLLMALQLSKKYPAAGGVAATRFNAALNHPAGVIESNSDNATLNFPGGVFNHPLYQYYFITLRYDYGMSKTISDIMNGNNDNRRNAYGSSTNGVPYGYTQSDIGTWINGNNNWSWVLAANHRTPSSPVVIIGAANVYLARAEAANRGWTAENQATMYALGIQRSWEQWAVYNAGNFATYLAASSVDLGSGNALQKIQLQQWLAWYPNGTRGWANWRRTNVPVLTPAPNNSNKPIPRRMQYGSEEPQLNPVNYATAAAQYTVAGNPNSQDAPVWWDQ
jgi:hypothetical protein